MMSPVFTSLRTMSSPYAVPLHDGPVQRRRHFVVRTRLATVVVILPPVMSVPLPDVIR